jgi:integrase/recombinase XerD
MKGFRELIKEFCRDCELRGMTAESVRRYRSNLRLFAEFLERSENGGKVHVDNRALRAFLEHMRYERGVKHKTLENCFSALSAFYDYLAFEGIVSTNPVLPFRRRYLRRYKDENDDPERKLLSVEEMSRLANSIMDPRDKAMVVVLAKTGVRRGELLRMDVDDVDWHDRSITLKPTPKRSNRVVFFDEECAVVLRRWLAVRERLKPRTCALFISYETLDRLSRNGLWRLIDKYARRLGFHKPDSPRLEDHFNAHCFRHWFTTWLRRNGMPREFIQELRGDRRRDAIDIYDHIDREELRRAYLACVPKLGI